MRRLLEFAMTLVFGLAALPAFAQAPSSPLVFSWTGCHVGVSGGVVHDENSFRLKPSGSYLQPAGVLAPPNAGGTGALAGDITAVSSRRSESTAGFIGGGQIGCDRVWTDDWFGVQAPTVFGARLAFGVEADFSGSTLSIVSRSRFGPVVSANPAFTVSSRTERVSNDLDWVSTLRGRTGLAFEQFYVYATGGLAIADFSSTTTVSFGSNGSSPVYANSKHHGSNSETQLGWVAGGGVEYAVTDRWSLKAEYLVFGFDSQSYRSPLVAPGGVAPGYSWSTHISSSNPQLLRFGANFRFY